MFHECLMCGGTFVSAYVAEDPGELLRNGTRLIYRVTGDTWVCSSADCRTAYTDAIRARDTLTGHPSDSGLVGFTVTHLEPMPKMESYSFSRWVLEES
jgi:hypothetical protein